MNVYDGCKIHGLYLRSDGRQHVIVCFPDKTKKTVSYPKYLMEKHLNRYLDKDETVDHIDRNFNNNEISNLQVLSREEHCILDVIRYKDQTVICPVCNKEFILTGKKISAITRERNRGKSQTGPYCSKSCAGKGSHISISLNSLEILEK